MASSALEEKINKIRQQNEEIRRRHEEVEADKQHAAKLNALVQMVPSTDWPERKEPPEFIDPVPKNNSKPKTSAREHRGQQHQYHVGGGDGKKVHVFAVGDGPPPDPSYNFLADSERDDRIKENSRDSEKFKGRDSRGGSKKRGTSRSASFKESRVSGVRPKDFSKPEYEAWRAERNRIDEARISRQRTAEGNWRREWDNNKINIEDNEEGSTKTVRVTTDVRKDYKEFDKWPVDSGNDYDSARGRGGKYHSNRAAPRGSHINRGYYRSKSFEYQGPLSPVPPLSPSAIDERMVLATDKSLKVIVNHGPTSPKGPLMSVRVSPASIAGTGRVGPRQKPRILYSSQADGDITSNDLDKFSGHKSPDDKARRSFHHRDSTEQRYSPKSPHLQRKAENNVNLAFTRKKDLKHDGPISVQSQKYAENESRSQQSQKHEIKDNLKSPHFQKKVEFANCDTQFKQRNEISESDGKSFQPQKKIFEKNRNDFHRVSASPKNSANKNEKKKNERNDDDTPKSQRTTKRTDKSKAAPNRNVSESQTAHRDTNGVQVETNGSIKISENISNDNEYDKKMSSSVNVCEPDNSKDINNTENPKNGSEQFCNALNDSENVSGSSPSEVCDKSVVDSSELISTSAIFDAEKSSENLPPPKSVENKTSQIIHNEDLPDLDNIAVKSNAPIVGEIDIAPSNDETTDRVTDEKDIEPAVIDTDRNNGDDISIPKVSNDEIADVTAVEDSRNVTQITTVINTLPEVSKTDICLNPTEVFDKNGGVHETAENIIVTNHSSIFEQKEEQITTTEISSNNDSELAEMSLQKTQ